MTVLITGGAGFIGSRLALHMIDQGVSTVIVDNFDPYYDPALKRRNIAEIDALGKPYTLIEADIRDTQAMESFFVAHAIRKVAHLAAMANVRYSLNHGHLYSEVNTTATVGLLDISRRHGVEMFVLGSTSSVYGQAAQVPFREDDPAVEPLAPYPASKRAAELFARTYNHVFGLPVNVLRFFNVYGPNGRPDMMPMRAIDMILNGEPIPIFDEGRMLRDWTYIEDIVNGIVAALNMPNGFQIYNLGFGSPISLMRFIEIYEQLICKHAITKAVPAPNSEPPVTYCDNSKARQVLGFAPATDIEEGLAKTWAWYQARVAK